MSSKTDKRAKEILRLLLNEGKASVDELSSALNTSPASIRRDLIRLESHGLVTRTLGGAMLTGSGSAVYEPFRFDASFRERVDRFAAEKQRIARAAAALILENETIGFTAGTTTTLIARQLLHRKNIHVVTNAINIGMELGSAARVETMLTGGNLRWAGAFSLVGLAAVEAVSLVVLDRLFLSVTGVDVEHGATVIQHDEAAVFRAMVRQARQVIVVADSSKVGRVSPAVICPLRDMDVLITDNGISEEAVEAFKRANIQVVVA
jgi:DeoR family transcriptional regulator, aga operon transcriptional repressor